MCSFVPVYPIAYGIGLRLYYSIVSHHTREWYTAQNIQRKKNVKIYQNMSHKQENSHGDGANNLG
jgi:hypothetical protein